MKASNESPNKNNFKINKGLYLIDITKFNNSTPDQLWEKKQRKEFFTWIYVFLAAMLIILILNLLKVLFIAIDKESIINYLRSSNSNATYNQLEQQWALSFGSNIIQMIFPFAVTISLALSIKKCIKLKTFKFISFLSTIFVFIQMIYGFFDAFQYLFQYATLRISIFDSFKASWVFVLGFVLTFVYPVIWFFISRNVSAIRMIAIRAESREMLFKQANAQFGQTGVDPFGASMFTNRSQAASKNNSQINPKENDEFYKRLKNLSKNQLEELAKELSISGFESMTNEEIIEIIYNIRSVQNQNSKEIEVEPTSKKDTKNDDNNL